MAQRKILIAAMGLDIGGAETHVAVLTRELAARGNDVIVVSAGGVYERDITGCGARHVFAPLNTRSPLAMLKALTILKSIIRREKPDVVHAHARIPAFLCGLVWRMTPKYRRFRFVTTAHWVFAVTRVTRLLSDWGQKSLAVSEDIKQYLIDSYDMPERDITVTVNGIDTEQFKPGASGEKVRRELGIPDSAPVALTISRLDPVAGEAARCLIEAAPELLKQFPELRIVITGGSVVDDGTFENELRRNAQRVNEQFGRQVIIMTGARSDIGDILAICDVFICVSRSALEALAAGKPVILAGGEGYLGRFTPEIRDLAIETNLTCRGYGKTTPELLIQAIPEVLRDPNRADTSYGREFVIENYSVARVADDAEACYDSALPRRRVVMSGYYGFGNAGDEAILNAVRGAVESIGYCDVTVLSRKPHATSAVHGCRAIGRFNPFAVLPALRRASVLVFGGGSLLQDETSTRSLLYYLTILRLAHLFGVKTMVYANGIGPVTIEANRRRVAKAVLRADVVTLRDAQSIDELAAMGVPRDRLLLTSDPVMLSDVPDAEESAVIVRALGLTAPYAAFSVRRYAKSPGITAELARLADLLNEKMNLGIVFLPMHISADIAASEDVARLMKTQPYAPIRSFLPREIFAILRCSQTAVTMRLHTLIFAARVGAPTAAIDINPKINAFLAELNMPNLGKPDSFRAESAFDSVRNLALARANRSAELLSAANSLAERAKSDADILRSLLR